MAKVLQYTWPYHLDYSDTSNSAMSRRIKEEQNEMDRLQKISDNLPEGEVVGGILSWPVADGKSYYYVYKRKPFTVAWIPYLDAYQADPILLRGLNLADAVDQLAKRKYLIELFGSKEKEESWENSL